MQMPFGVYNSIQVPENLKYLRLLYLFMKGKILKTYDKKGNIFKKFSPIDNDFTDLIKKNLKKDSVVLDLGCGGGRLTVSINEYAKKVVGIDFSRELITQAKKNAKRKNIRYVVMDGERLSFAPATFDMVISHAVINKRMCKANPAFKGAYRVLRKGGLLIVKIINRSWGKEFKFKGGYDKKEIANILDNTGFKNVKIDVQRKNFTAHSYEDVKWINDTEASILSPKKAFEEFFKKGEMKGKYAFDDSFMTAYAEKKD
jgi:ubiquinone/menaquinone biosynthesis C-methylase UbiE